MSGAKRSARTNSGAVFEWRDVFGAHTEKGLAVTESRWPVTSNPQGRFSECAKVAGEQDGALLERLIGRVEGGAVRHHAQASERTTKNDSGTTLSTCSCVENTTGIPSSPATLNPHNTLAIAGSSSRP